jgi:stearoyl-CoA desaturase (delta-9 desaturase)
MLADQGILPVIFALFHLGALGAIWTGVSTQDFVICGVLYALNMFGVTAGYHRYFSHRTFRTNRVFQFVLAWIAQGGAQKGVLWWAAHHRVHHRHSDQPGDVHSPVQDGVWHSHIGWLMDASHDATRWDKIRDFARYPELRWLNRFYLVPPTITGLAVLFLFGWSALWTGFFLAIVLSWHATFCVNSVAHLFGSRRYETPDDSRNNPVLALFTMGEGWHNNHHHDMNSCRQGHRWWELDLTWMILKTFSWIGLVSDLRPPKAHLTPE